MPILFFHYTYLSQEHTRQCGRQQILLEGVEFVGKKIYSK